MKKIIIISLLFCLILISCQKETSVQIIEPITEQKEWTILIYMVGDSNLEKFAIKDINEIEKVIKSDEIEVYVFLDRDEKHDKTNDDWTGAKLYKLNWDKNPSIINSKIIKYYSEVDSSDSSIILDTINISFKNPSKKNGLIFWGHGNGWKGYGFDNSHNKSSTSMNNFTDLSNSIKKLNIPKFDFVFFFSCLMGQLEVQSNFIGISKYFVGSEDLMYISNSFYSLVFQELSNNPSVSAIEIIKIIADKYYERIPLRTIQKEITISIIDLDKLNESLTSFNNLMSVLYKNEFHYNVLKSRLYTHEFFLSRENSNYIDLIDFLNILSFDNAFKNIKEDILNVKKSFFESILFSKSGSSQNRANGISIFMPKNIDNFDQNYTKIPFVQDNIGWKNLLDELKIYLEKDKIPP
ncbi:hypothetical protein HN451_10635, partial [archaeon]|nr:hypothetical protein [archaeon]